MDQIQAALGHASQEEQEAYDRALARQLFGDELKERLIVNAELGIFPVDDDDE